MDIVVLMVLLFEGLLVLGAIALIIYLIVRRVGKKKSETFEDRDN